MKWLAWSLIAAGFLAGSSLREAGSSPASDAKSATTVPTTGATTRPRLFGNSMFPATHKYTRLQSIIDTSLPFVVVPTCLVAVPLEIERGDYEGVMVIAGDHAGLTYTCKFHVGGGRQIEKLEMEAPAMLISAILKDRSWAIKISRDHPIASLPRIETNAEFDVDTSKRVTFQRDKDGTMVGDGVRFGKGFVLVTSFEDAVITLTYWRESGATTAPAATSRHAGQ